MTIHLKKSLIATAICMLSASSFTAAHSSESQSPAWMTKLWAWADEFAIHGEELPRNKAALLAMTQLKIARCEYCNYGAEPKITYLPPEIGQLTNLRELNLYGNKLQSLPPQIGQLSNLQILGLESNQLRFFPPEIGQLSNLQKLAVSDNQLQFLPVEIGQLKNLQELWLRSNQLQYLPESFTYLNQLNFLNIEFNPQLKLTDAQDEFIDAIETVRRDELDEEEDQGDELIFQ